MADQDSTRTLADIITELRHDASTHPEARDLDEGPWLIAEALVEIDRRLRVLEACRAGAWPDPHIWVPRAADGSSVPYSDAPGYDHTSCARCGVRR